MSNLGRLTQIGGATLLMLTLSIAKVQEKDIVQTLSATDNTKTFTKMVDDVGLTDMLKGQGPYTVLVPNDTAFSNLQKENPSLYEKVTTDKALERKVVQYHMLNGSTMAGDLKDGTDLDTLEGEKIHVTVATDGPTFDTKGRVVTADTKASNGVVHVVDTVLVPKSVRPASRIGK